MVVGYTTYSGAERLAHFFLPGPQVETKSVSRTKKSPPSLSSTPTLDQQRQDVSRASRHVAQYQEYPNSGSLQVAPDP